MLFYYSYTHDKFGFTYISCYPKGVNLSMGNGVIHGDSKIIVFGKAVPGAFYKKLANP